MTIFSFFFFKLTNKNDPFKVSFAQAKNFVTNNRKKANHPESKLQAIPIECVEPQGPVCFRKKKKTNLHIRTRPIAMAETILILTNMIFLFSKKEKPNHYWQSRSFWFSMEKVNILILVLPSDVHKLSHDHVFLILQLIKLYS